MTIILEPQYDLVDLMVEAHREVEGKPRSERLVWAKRLGEYGILSKRQIGTIVGVFSTYLTDIVEKENRSGGRLEVESLPFIRNGVHALESDEPRAMELLYDAWRTGTSIPLLARLSGLTLNTLKARLYKIRAGVQGDE